MGAVQKIMAMENTMQMQAIKTVRHSWISCLTLLPLPRLKMIMAGVHLAMTVSPALSMTSGGITPLRKPTRKMSMVIIMPLSLPLVKTPTTSPMRKIARTTKR